MGITTVKIQSRVTYGRPSVYNAVASSFVGGKLITVVLRRSAVLRNRMGCYRGVAD